MQHCSHARWRIGLGVGTLHAFLPRSSLVSSLLSSRYTISAQNPEETYISQEVCTSLLYEAKEAVRRAETVSDSLVLDSLEIDQQPQGHSRMGMRPS